MEEHVESVHAILKRHAAAHDVDEIHSDDEEWNGFVDEAPPDIIDEEEEYIDEDKYTHVTVESVTVSRDGLERVTAEDDEAPDDEAEDTTENRPTADDKENAGRAAVRPRKPKKKKFRYESKAVRQLENMKQRTKSRRPKSK